MDNKSDWLLSSDRSQIIWAAPDLIFRLWVGEKEGSASTHNNNYISHVEVFKLKAFGENPHIAYFIYLIAR